MFLLSKNGVFVTVGLLISICLIIDVSSMPREEPRELDTEETEEPETTITTTVESETTTTTEEPETTTTTTKEPETTAKLEAITQETTNELR